MKFLVTGGPVHANLDAVKIITNVFKGGRMVALAQKLERLGHKVVYLTARHMPPELGSGLGEVWFHDGFLDYMHTVLKLSGEFDAVILGAAVANLIPSNPWTGKFPSHQYKVGDVVNIQFQIAPRIIDGIRSRHPKVKIFGYKLLSNVPYEELIEAAHEIVLDSHATVVFANDTKNLDRKYAVTKDRVVQPLTSEDLPGFIVDYTNDCYYHTEITDRPSWSGLPVAIEHAQRLVERFKDKFQPIGTHGLIFGTVACRIPGVSGFITTRRGKTEIGKGWEIVQGVYHNAMLVHTSGRASLNAPLLHQIFSVVPETKSIVHYHNIECPNLHQLPYAPPGTVRDSQRGIQGSFAIQGHGAFLLFGDDEREPIVWRK
jgi:hypothetical protein